MQLPIYTSKHYGRIKSSCVHINNILNIRETSPTYTVMVTACSNDSVLCDFDFMDADSILTYGGPVVDTLYGITFVNDKCAMCNGIPLWRIKPLEATLLCNPTSVLDYNYVMFVLSSNKSSTPQDNRLLIKDDDVREDLPLDPKTLEERCYPHQTAT